MVAGRDSWSGWDSCSLLLNLEGTETCSGSKFRLVEPLFGATSSDTLHSVRLATRRAFFEKWSAFLLLSIRTSQVSNRKTVHFDFSMKTVTFRLCWEWGSHICVTIFCDMSEVLQNFAYVSERQNDSRLPFLLICWLILRPERCSTFLRNVGELLQDYRALNFRQYSLTFFFSFLSVQVRLKSLLEC
jgi:hypothetical protein